MKQSLSLKLGQQLTMTPQLQQAIRLLQLSTLDLQLEVQLAIETNPMLELIEDDDYRLEDQADGAAEPVVASAAATEDTTAAGDEVTLDGDWQQQIPDDLPVDSSWDDVYPTHSTSSSAAPDGEGFDIDSRNSAAETLQDHLHWQLNLTPMTDRDRAIAFAIIDAVDDDGLLRTTIEDLAGAFDPSADVEIDEVAAVLKRVQQFDPPGIAGRDLKECLLIQLNQLPADTPWRGQAQSLLRDYLDLLASRDYTTLRRKTRLGDDELKHIIALIQSLNPRPGSWLSSRDPEYVIPDVIVSKQKDRWKVELNPEAAPRVRINADYARLVRRADNSTDNSFLRDHLQEARWFLKSLESRNETLLKVATRIVEHQRGFLEYGEEAMKPLVLHDIAAAVEMHESTISRVTTRKYMHTPRGLFELKYFFSSHVGTSTGGEVSSTAIRALIKKLTSEENPSKPLSDSKIAAILAEQNIEVARRTVAKYRELMLIPPSNERKRLV
jgi:RNA polymerase sigma-54 factor